jgi:hypothetical protein
MSSIARAASGILSAVLLLSIAAQAQEVQNEPLDANEDGFVTMDEWVAYRNTLGDYDANKNALIGREEYQISDNFGLLDTPLAKAELFTLFDEDQDGQLAGTEYFSSEAFSRLDGDDDEKLSEAELRGS